MSYWTASMVELEELRAEVAGLLKVAEAAAYVDLLWSRNWNASAIHNLRTALASLPEEYLTSLRSSAEKHFEVEEAAYAARVAEFDSWVKYGRMHGPDPKSMFAYPGGQAAATRCVCGRYWIDDPVLRVGHCETKKED